MNQRTHTVVDDYLRRLERELESLPRARRREILDEIQGHIDEARAELSSETEGDLCTLLERVGEPADIADEARRRFDVPAARFGLRETAALILLPLGGVLIPVLGWFIGVILLWSSSAWTRKEKIVGTLLPPGGLTLPLWLLVFPVTSETCVSRVDPATGTSVESCTVDPSQLQQTMAAVLIALVVLLAFATPLWLGRRLRKRQASMG